MFQRFSPNPTHDPERMLKIGHAPKRGAYRFIENRYYRRYRATWLTPPPELWLPKSRFRRQVTP